MGSTSLGKKFTKKIEANHPVKKSVRIRKEKIARQNKKEHLNARNH